MTSHLRADPLEGSVATCRSRMRQVLEALDGRPAVPPDEIVRLVEKSHCAERHELHYAALMDGLVVTDDNGQCRLGRAGTDWLDEEGRPSPNWQASTAAGSAPLRTWQVEALRAWCEHGRRGVVEAVTGTGKSRVGIEAAREALSDDYSVVIAVPTRDLVDQWTKSLRATGVPGVGIVGEGSPARFDQRRVLVGTVQSLYQDPPVREDGKVLLVADECHRYGAGQWRRLLHPSYRRRLGLTATFERNDDGINELLAYFGGAPVYRIGFDRAIAEGVVAHYDVKLHGVALSAPERADYDAAHETVVDSRMRLLTAGFAEEPFGLFLRQVSEAAEDRDGTEDPTIVEMARRYLRAFSERIEVMSSAVGKMEAVRQLAPRVTESAGTLLFTRTVDAAEEIAAVLDEEGVPAAAIHSNLTRPQRRERLDSLKAGRLKAVAAPTVLDEGVDVPAIDLAVVLGGSKSRRQMIQRMGRVLRLKSDGRSAAFIVVYARNTVEDLTMTDGREGCLDLIMRSADSVEQWAAAPATEAPDGDGDASLLSYEAGEPASEGPPERAETASAPPSSGPLPAALHLGHVHAETLPMTRAALNDYHQQHGGDDTLAERSLRETLAEFCRIGMVTRRPDHAATFVVRTHDIGVTFTGDRFIRYRCRRDDGLSWPELKQSLLSSRPLRSPAAWADRPWPETPARQRLVAQLQALGDLCGLVVSDRAVEQHRQLHGSSAAGAREDIQRLLEDLDRDHDRSRRVSTDELVVARSGYQVSVDPTLRTVSAYDSAGQVRTYSDYLDFGRARRRVSRLPMERPPEDSPLEIETADDLLDYVDFETVHYSGNSLQRLLPVVDTGHLNDWDIDRAIRHLMLADARECDVVHHLTGGNFAVQGADVLWVYRSDGLSVAALTDPDALARLLAKDEVAEVRASVRQDGGGVVAQIVRLVELKERGYLTDAEFAAAKAKVLA